MAAFRRRTAFAAPLIVIAGCGGNDSPKRPPSIPGTSWNVYKEDGACRAHFRIYCPPDVTCNPPGPMDIECPVGANNMAGVVVVEKPDKTCAIVPEGCVKLSCATRATPCPERHAPPPPPPKLVAIWSIQPGRGSADSCVAYDELACSVPPGQPAPPCNPPPPQPVACPAGFKPDQPMRIGQLPNGSCAIVVPGCVHATCVDQAIACPEPAPSK